MISWVLCGILLILVIILIIDEIQYTKLTRKDSEKIRKILRATVNRMAINAFNSVLSLCQASPVVA